VLEHHGIKGMKWGVRKTSSSEGGELKPSADHETVTGYKERASAGGVKNLSNKELQELVNRMNLEQQHRNLQAQQPSKFEKGHQHIKKVLAVAKTGQDVYNLYNSPAGKALRKAVSDASKKGRAAE
jgi:hypothetical protein